MGKGAKANTQFLPNRSDLKCTTACCCVANSFYSPENESCFGCVDSRQCLCVQFQCGFCSKEPSKDDSTCGLGGEKGESRCFHCK
eukprot:gene8118-4207_t